MKKTPKPRTLSQNSAMHLWCSELSRECQNTGKTMKVFIDKINVDVTPDAVKMMIQKIGETMYSKSKTSDFTTAEMTSVCREVDKIMIEEGINISFPSFEEKEFIKLTIY